jgi:hypothetical protein
MRRRLQRLLARLLKAITPKPDTTPETRLAIAELKRAAERNREAEYRASYMERAAELIEAKQMAGSGPWLVYEARDAVDEKRTEGSSRRLREANPMISQGAYGDIELALQNVEWRREVNLSWLEFSRWGIQQIILISRLYYIKHPICRRLIDIASTYVFGRGVEVSSDDEDANDVLKEFFDRNKKTLGQIALVELEKRKYYDGNLFFVFFADTQDTGKVTVRTIDATEIFDIVCDPDDSDSPWYYRRGWNARLFDQATGQTSHDHKDAYYPSLEYSNKMAAVKVGAPGKPEQINSIDVMWDNPVLHRKCGGVAKWHFGCPIVYPMLDWAKAAGDFLKSCATVKKALAQISMTLTTKGGQQAIEGAKQQLMTTVGPSSSLWDTNPTALDASIFASGPGTVLSAFNTKGGGGDPEEVRQYKLMCCIVVGVPETFLADVSTGNLATATTLDRPTELVFAEKQEAWREDLTTIAQYVLTVSKNASGGQLREALNRRYSHVEALAEVVIVERKRHMLTNGQMVYVFEKSDTRQALTEAKKKPAPIQITVTFPAIREGDLPQVVKAIAEAMTLDNKGGQIVGIDEKVGIGLLYRTLGVENSEDVLEEQYPDKEYDPDRTKVPEAAPVMPIKAQPNPGGEPQATPAQAANQPALSEPLPGQPQKSTESVLSVARRLEKLGTALLERNGHAE